MRTLWKEHWTNGGTGMTIISEDKMPLFIAAVAKMNDPNIFIVNNALHYSKAPSEVDISHFWKIFHELEKAQKSIKSEA